jgi:O-antigen/teichoic acid export membrane protein
MIAQRRFSTTDDLRTVVHNAGATFAGITVGTALGYLTQIVMARSLGTAAYGRFALGFTVFSVLAVVAQVGLPQGIVRFVAVFRGSGDDGRVKGTIALAVLVGVISSAVLAAGLVLASRWLALRLFHDAGMRGVLAAFSALLPWTTLTTMVVSSLQGLRALKLKALVREVVEPLLRAALVVACLTLGGRLVSVVVSYAAAALLTLLVAVFLLKRVYPPAFAPQVKAAYEPRLLFGFSWPLLFVYAMGNLFSVSDSLLLGVLRGSAEVGAYCAAQRTALCCGFVLTSFISILAPLGADHYHQGRSAEIEGLFKTVSRWSLTCTLPVGLLLVAYGPGLLGLFGRDFARASVALTVLSAGWMLHSFGGSAGTILTMTGRSKLHMVNFTGLIAWSLAANLFLIPRWGLAGAAAATALSLLLLDIVTLIEVTLVVGIHPFAKELLKPLGAAAFAGVPLLLLARATPQPYPLALVLGCGLAFLAVYAGTLALLGASESERMLLRELRNRMRAPNGR